MATREFYSYELNQNITVRGMSTLGMIHAAAVLDTVAPRDPDAAAMAAMLEALRDGMVEPSLSSNGDLIQFVRQYPKTAVRAFETIQRLTGAE